MSWVTKNIDKSVADYIFTLRVDLPNRTLFQRDVRPDLIIDYEDLIGQLTELPEMLAFFDSLLAEQKVQVAVLEAKREAVRGDLTSEIIENARHNNVKLSIPTIKDIVVGDDRMIQIQAEMILKIRTEHKLKSVVNALQRKSEHLRSLAGFKREEQRSS